MNVTGRFHFKYSTSTDARTEYVNTEYDYEYDCLRFQWSDAINVQKTKLIFHYRQRILTEMIPHALW